MSDSVRSKIHPTAIVHPDAILGENVEIGEYAYVGAGVRLGNNCRLHHHATVDGNSEIGDDNEFFPYCCVGLKSQDKKYAGGKPGLKVGTRNVFREFCTVHAATNDGDYTIVGSDNLFLAYTHIAHDCVVGSHVVFSNNGTLAGHVTVEDHVILGGLSAVHQFCRLGAYAMIGGCSKIVQDVPPYTIADGNPAVLRSVNKVGMERAGFSAEQIREVRNLYRLFFRSNLTRGQINENLPELIAGGLGEHFCRFIQESKRGVLTASQSQSEE
jgi:UDP-N-acetylglucosamine acyltransferase